MEAKIEDLMSRISELEFENSVLKESEDNFRSMFEGYQDVFYKTDLKGTIIDISPSILKYSGFSRDSLIGTPVFNVYKNPEDRNLVISILQSKGEIIDYNLHLLNKSGGSILCSLNAYWLKDSSGNIIGIQGSLRDITMRKKAEEALQESEENFRNFFEVMEDIVVIAALDGRILYWNKALPEKLGYTTEELKKMYVLDLRNHEKRKEAEEIFTAVLKSGKDFCQLPLQRKDGSYLQAETRIWFGKWNGENCIFGLTKDLTEQQAALDKFQKIFNHNPNLMALSKIEDRTFIDVNSSFLEKFGYSRDEIIGKSSSELGLFVQKEMQDEVNENLAKYGRINNIEIEAKAKDGSILNGLFSGEIIDNQFEKSILTVLVDITERKKKEAELKLLNENLRDSRDLIEVSLLEQKALIEELERTQLYLEESINVKDKFFSIIAHDLKSPFSGFLGLTKLMAENFQELTMNEIQEFSGDLMQSANNLYKLLGNLLEWSRMQRGLIQFNPNRVQLSFIVNEIINIKAERAKQKEIEIITRIPNDFYVNADIQMTNTIIRNLLSNALKFTPHSGNVEIGAIYNFADRYFEIYIKDSGIGIDEDSKSKLFKIEEKVSRLGTDGEPSTGLGLILSKEFVEKHGGKIWVESELGIGSTFWFSLPKDI